VVDLCYPKGTLPVGGEFVCPFMGEYALEHHVTHLELPATHELLVIALERPTVLRVSHSCLPSSLIDEVDVITPKLVLCSFIVCLDTGGAHGDFRGDDSLNPIHQKERCLPYGLTR
jgi:hypothetical protein